MTNWRSILEPVGWPLIERASPLLAAQLAAKLDRNGGLVAGTPSSARIEAEKIEALARLVHKTMQQLENLPTEQRRTIGLATLTVLPSDDNEVPDPTGDAVAALWRVLDGLTAQMDRLDQMTAKGGRGGQANLPAREVAHAVACLWIIARAEPPSLGRLADGSGLSGEYGRTVERVLSAVGIRCADAYRPAKDALDALLEDEARLDALMLVRCPLTRHLVSLEMARRQ